MVRLWASNMIHENSNRHPSFLSRGSRKGGPWGLEKMEGECSCFSLFSHGFALRADPSHEAVPQPWYGSRNSKTNLIFLAGGARKRTPPPPWGKGWERKTGRDDSCVNPHTYKSWGSPLSYTCVRDPNSMPKLRELKSRLGHCPHFRQTLVA